MLLPRERQSHKGYIKEFLLVDGDCSRECPHFLTCCKICTEIVYSDTTREGQVDILFVGQGAGKDEERLGRPFVGKAGLYLRQMIDHLWTTDRRFNVGLSNTVRCRPTDANGKDRVPSPREETCCWKNLALDIGIMSPKVIVTVGKSATTCVVGAHLVGKSMSKIRGEFRTSRGCGQVLPTFHPSYLARNNGRFDKTNLTVLDTQVMRDIRRALEFTRELPF